MCAVTFPAYGGKKMANERLRELRTLMKVRNVDAYYVPSSDFHDSEYVEDYFKCRAFLSGFTGSAGTMVITQAFSGMWTDGRYFVQAKKELEGQDTRLMAMGEEGVPTIEEYLMDHMPEGGVLGFDGRVVNAAQGRKFETMMAEKHATLSVGDDLAGEVWDERPILPAPEVWALDVKYAGETVAEKLSRLRAAMKEKDATVHILSSLDDVAWLFNIRKNSDDGNVLAPAFALITEDTARLFIASRKFSPELRAYFEKNHVTIEKYDAIYDAVAELKNETVLLEPEKVNFALYKKIDASNRIVEAMNPTSLMKAVKNPVEMENLRKAHLKDGVALTKFLYWMKKNAGKVALTETEAAERLEDYRKAGEGYLGPSFTTISAFGSNAAMCHYHATKEQESPVETDGFYLVDSGGQYYEGTTDITRTIVVGPLTEEEKEHFTITAMGTLRLGNAKFLHGCIGINLDYLARQAFWERGLDFNHGTGHGVGYLLNVHERPNGFRWKMVPERMENAVLEEGMLTSDEPGIYIEGSHGIRTENLMLCRKAEKNMYGQFMRFEFVTMVPIDLDGIDTQYMTEKDVELLNNYHKEVYEKISPYLEGDEKEWLKEATRTISK